MWNELVEGSIGPERPFLVDKACISESHRRCVHWGVPRDLAKPRHELSARDRTALLARYERLLSVAKPVFQDLYHHLCGGRIIIILTDENAHVVWLLGPAKVEQVLDRHCGIRVGTSLQERSAGTNAIALALRYRNTSIVEGEQHFCRMFHTWRHIAAPLVDASSEVIGCLSLASVNEVPIGEKLALTKCAAKLLEVLWPGTSFAQHHAAERRSVALTDRQKRVLSLYADGFSYKQIANRLGLRSTKTVEQHLAAICRKLAAQNHRTCILKAARAGLL